MASEPAPDIDANLSWDEIEIIINDVTMRVRRQTNLPWPHEVTAVIPRAELRQRRYLQGQLVSEDEVILNSITIVHAPRHPLAGERPPAPGSQPGAPSPGFKPELSAGPSTKLGSGRASGPDRGPDPGPTSGPNPGPSPASAGPPESKPPLSGRYRITLRCPRPPQPRPQAPGT